MLINKRTKSKNKKTLANILLRNYVISYFVITISLMLIFIITIIIAVALYFNINKYDNTNANTLMKDNYEEIDTKHIEISNGFLEVVDKNHRVIYRKGVNPNKTDQYSISEYYKIMNSNEAEGGNGNVSIDLKTPKDKENPNSEEKYFYSVAYNEKNEFLLVIAIPESQFLKSITKEGQINPKNFIIMVLVTAFLMLALVFMWLSRITSKNFIKPLKALREGAKQISEGNYDTRIDIKSENEFGDLRDAFNMMAEEIEKERKLKEKAEENRRNLILDISHDLKNPLSSIMGYSEYILKNQTVPKEEYIKYLETIKQNSQRANNLIQDLFEFSKVESSEFKLNLKSVDICEFLRGSIAGYIPQFEEKEMEYYFDIPEEKIFLIIDEKNLDRALSNLIINAIKYNPNKTKITITAQIIKNQFVITISDDGIGISKHMQERIFEAFVRVDSSRNSQSGGTGLGLAITKKIIEKHGGRVMLTSDVNEGSTFTVTLPIS